MSVSYLVAKKDADAYDAIEKELQPLRIKMVEEEQTAEQEDLDVAQVYEKYSALAKKIFQKYGYPDGIKTISIFDKKPLDLENYFTYYRGMRWGEAKGCAMHQIHEKGLEVCKKALKK